MRSKKLEGLIEEGFITQAQAQYLGDAIGRKESLIISGHRGHGLTQLFGSLLMSIDKETTSFKQVRKPESDLEEGFDYYIIGDLKDVEWEDMLKGVLSRPGSSVMVMKAPEYSYSVMKIMKELAGAPSAADLVVQVVECKKIEDVKKVAKITRMTIGENGRPVREDFQG